MAGFMRGVKRVGPFAVTVMRYGMKRFIALALVVLFTLSGQAFSMAESEQPSESLSAPEVYTADQIPAFDTQPIIELNRNEPLFYVQELTKESSVHFSDLDTLGRIGVAQACIGPDILPTTSRESIGQIQPSGWQTTRYDDLIDDHYLFNRCHLIGYQLCGKNDVENLFTGTRYLNVELMLQYEAKIAEYVKSTGNHVLLRATPIYTGDDLVATGVNLEAFSVEDIGSGIRFNVFLYNIQPGIVINYADGTSMPDPKNMPVATPTPEPLLTLEPTATDEPAITRESPQEEAPAEEPKSVTYILNTNSKKFHYPSCSSVGSMSNKNKKEFFGTRDEAIAKGYVPCKKCNP